MRRHLRAAGATAALLVSLTFPGARASAQATPTLPALPAARPADVASVDAIIAALYDVISGPAGQKREWDRFRSLFIAGARLIPTAVAPDGTVRHRVLTPDEYVTGNAPALETRGFFENEIGRVTETFGNITHVFSTYASRATPEGQPFARGINSIQLLNDGKRWWIVTVYWDQERAGLTLPEKYLKKGGS
jgi:hypothetical protein